MPEALLQSNIKSLPLLARGKVRDNYAVGDDRLLMVASDRLSAFDVVMGEPIPGKGELLTRMALFWFEPLGARGAQPPDRHRRPKAWSHARRARPGARPLDAGQRLSPLPIEAVVRGYLAGSGWKEYQQTPVGVRRAAAPGLVNAGKLPQPIFTPATKAEAGAHDENISFEQLPP
jgi:phosphoribosylaminoimidazole-succinocarboxamide synthase